MFEYLYGTVEYKKMDYIAIDINGVGYRVYFPLREYEKIEVGNKYKFYIYNHIKEDTYKLIGFLDEPTTGLHFQDIKKLLEVLNRLLEKGNTVIIIEHNLDVIKTADHIIDIGVDGGENGGTVVATGTPEEIAKSKKSYTGKYIAKILKSKK